MRLRRPLTALVLASSLALASCGGGSSDSGKSSSTTEASSGSGSSDAGSTDPGATATSAVKIADFAFEPDSIEVKVGDTVTFTNDDSATHTATAGDDAPKAFDTGKLSKGDSKDITFDEAGDYEYQCSIHDYMTGTVRVME